MRTIMKRAATYSSARCWSLLNIFFYIFKKFLAIFQVPGGQRVMVLNEPGQQVPALNSFFSSVYHMLYS